MVRVSPLRREGLSFAATPDFLDIGEAEVLARALARYQPSDDAKEFLADRAANARAGQDFLDLFGIADARLWDPHQLWGRVTGADRLRIPLGKTPAGKVTWLDIKEGAEGGMGPHGQLVGQTGSGKSEHLTAIVLTLCMMFPPEMVQILLGDFKGEATFGALEHLPHVQGVVSNLTSSQHKLDRLQDVINGEVMRREEVLKKSGYKNVRDYEQARATTKKDLEPLGALIIVFDELAELLNIRNEMAKTLERVGLVGRALWIHILTASQRVDSGKMGGLLPQLTYSIGMKVKDAAQSRAAIGSPRAYEDLKRSPQGSAFLVVDDEHTRYRSFYVSAPFVEPKPSTGPRRHGDGQFIEVHPFTAHVTPLPNDIEDISEEQSDEEPVAKPGVDAPTVLTVLADRISRAGGRQKHRLWLPALEDTDEIRLDELVGEFWGRDWRAVAADSGLVVPYAREDDPFRHTQDVVSVDLSGPGGNVAVVGGTQTGKSTTLQTLLMMLAVSHSPQRVQVYGMDLGGGHLSNVAALPHVSGIAGRGSDEKMRRVLSEVERLLRRREREWDHAGINLAEFRARKFGSRAGAVPDDGHGDVFLVIDNISALQRDFLDLHDRVVSLADSQPLNYGIHLIISNDQWLTIKPQILNKCGSRIELRMTAANESEMKNREAAAKVPDQPGRGLRMGGKHMLVGVPGADGEEFAEGAAATAAEVARRWAAQGVRPAPELQLLPTEIAYDALPPAPSGTLKLGVGELEMSTVGVDLSRSPHFYAVGISKCGRSTVLRTLLTSIMNTYTPAEAQVVLFDPSYDLADALDDAYRTVYASTVAEISAAAAAIAQKLNERRPPPGTPPTELARWRFSGPRWFIVVDDLNMLTPPGTNQSALFPLVAGIESGQQLGLHVLAAHSGERWFGTGKLNKVIGAMDAAGAGVLVMDGNKSEKIIDDVRAAPRLPGRGELVYRKGANQLVQVALPPVRGHANSAEGVG